MDKSESAHVFGASVQVKNDVLGDVAQLQEIKKSSIIFHWYYKTKTV